MVVLESKKKTEDLNAEAHRTRRIAKKRKERYE
jgi:hypothetical protein